MKLKLKFLITIKKETWFYLSFCIYYIALFLNTIDIFITDYKIIIQVFKLVSLSILFLLDIKLIKFKRSILRLILLSVLGIFIFLVAIFTKDMFAIAIILFVYTSQKINSHNIFKVSFWLLVIGIMVVLGLCIVGILPNIITYRDIYSLKPRYSLGFYHSNVLPIAFFYVAAYYYSFKKECSLLSIFIFGGLNFFIYYICNSRNGLLCMGGALIILFCYTFFGRKLNQCIYLTAYNIVLFLTLFSAITLFLYKIHSKIGYIVNIFFTNRLYLATKFIEYSPIQLVNFWSYEGFKALNIALDNGFYYLGFRYGVIYLFVLIYINHRYIRILKTDNNYVAMILFVFVMTSIMVDNTLFAYGFFPFYISSFKKSNIYL